MRLFLQIACILAVCRVVGLVVRRFGQPQVIAEMLAGVLLGPSLLGLFFPDAFRILFPAESMRVLYPLAQVGLALYMFCVGLEFSIDMVRQRFKSAMAVSLAGIAAPFVLGALLGWALFSQTNLFPNRTTLPQASLFLGASMAITAFPVLARILQAKNLTATSVGVVALSAGAIGDAAAWGILAVILASLDGGTGRAVWDIVGGLAFVGVVTFVLRPWLASWGRQVEARGELTEGELILCLALLWLGAWATDLLGLHAVFGAFVMGTAMPRGLVTKSLIGKIQPLTVALLVPLFFTYSGLNTELTLLSSASLWLVAGIILVVAIVGKGVACWLAALASGLSNRESLGVGILMNARGLMELIILNIGLERGLLSPALFAALVVMAVVTTIMTSPMFDWLAREQPLRSEPVTSAAEIKTGVSRSAVG